jgi:phosphoglucosamine mutase
MGKYFGTDGVRGLANKELTPLLAFKLGRAVATVLIKEQQQPGKPEVIIGRDTRISGGMLEAALTAGFCAAGVDVVLAGVIPTPGIAYLTKQLAYAGGVVISASHNWAPDNGIKFFGSNGYKLPDEVEDEIEAILFKDDEYFPQPTGQDVGKVVQWGEGKWSYAHYVKTTIEIDLSGMKIVLDCGNGATSELAPKIFTELGAEVIVIAGQPDGININENCGSTHPETLQQQVKERGAQLGFAFDGDGDRVLAVDGQGNLIDGDQILLMLANDYLNRGLLDNNLLVVTVMSNLGLHQAARRLGINVLETKVGDRYVLEEMLNSDSIIGGEQSGHIILLKHNTTGDGILTGIQLLAVLASSGTTIEEQAGIMEKLPQVLANVPVKEKRNLDQDAEINKVIKEVDSILTGRGRLLVRPSGTEPLVRVMAEGPDKRELEELVGKVVAVIKARG